MAGRFGLLGMWGVERINWIEGLGKMIGDFLEVGIGR
jgi:hypothetical protein